MKATTIASRKRQQQPEKIITTTKRTKITTDDSPLSWPNAMHVTVKGSSAANCPSSSLIPARLDELMSMEWVGKAFVPQEGCGSFKAAVMETIGCSVSKFNKYSGIQPFNNALVIFINADGKCYENAFKMLPNNRMHVRWFAQDTHTMETPIIQRLINKEHVFLFIRNESEPYLYCGEVAMNLYEGKERPIRFEFNLLASPHLIVHSKHFARLFGL